MGAAVFKKIDGAAEIVFDQLTGARSAVDSGKDGGVRSGINDVITPRQSLEVRGVADVAAIELDA